MHAAQQSEAAGTEIPALAEFVQSATFDDLTELTRTRVAEHLMATVGVALAGSAEPSGRIISDMVA